MARILADSVRSMGSCLSENQARQLRIFKIATLMLDGDQPGREAGLRELPILARNHITRLIELPQGISPDDAPEQLFRSLLNL